MTKRSELRAQIKAALAKAGEAQTSAQLFELLGTKEPKTKITSTLWALTGSGELKKLPGATPHTSLYAIAGDAAIAGSPDTRQPRAAKKGKPTANGGSAPRHNAQDFTAALTSDKRLVLIGASEPVIFSAEQTLSIADIIFENFEPSR